MHRVNFQQEMFFLSQQVKISCVQYMIHCSDEQDEFLGGVPPVERLLLITPCLLTQEFTLIPVLIWYLVYLNSDLPPSDEVTRFWCFSPCHAAHFTLRDQN